MDISYSDGRTVKNAVVCIWEDLNTEARGNWVRAFWAASPEADSGSPVIGYCSSGGSHRTIIAAAREVWRHHPDARVFRNGREILSA
jgi:hypothetical protein